MSPPADDAEDELLTLRDAAQRYDVDAGALRKAARTGQIEGAEKRPTLAGSEWMVPAEGVEALIELGLLRSGRTAPPPVGNGNGAANGVQPPLNGVEERRGGGWAWVVGAAALVAALLVGLLALTGEDEPDDDVATPTSEEIDDEDPTTSIVDDEDTTTTTEDGPISDEDVRDAIDLALTTSTDPDEPIAVLGDAARGLLGDRDVVDAVDPGVPTEVVVVSGAVEPGIGTATLESILDQGELIFEVADADPPVQIWRVSGGIVSPTTEAPATTTTEAVTTTTEAVTTTTEAVTTTTSPPTTSTTVPPTTAPPTTAPPTTAPPATPPPDDPTVVPAGTPTAGADYTVVEGDNFWTIAERALAEDLGRAPTDAEIIPYWLDVIDANSDSLPEPGNPDLIYVGSVFSLPGT